MNQLKYSLVNNQHSFQDALLQQALKNLGIQHDMLSSQSNVIVVPELYSHMKSYYIQQKTNLIEKQRLYYIDLVCEEYDRLTNTNSKSQAIQSQQTNSNGAQLEKQQKFLLKTLQVKQNEIIYQNDLQQKKQQIIQKLEKQNQSIEEKRAQLQIQREEIVKQKEIKYQQALQKVKENFERQEQQFVEYGIQMKKMRDIKLQKAQNIKVIQQEQRQEMSKTKQQFLEQKYQTMTKVEEGKLEKLQEKMKIRNQHLDGVKEVQAQKQIKQQQIAAYKQYLRDLKQEEIQQNKLLEQQEREEKLKKKEMIILQKNQQKYEGLSQKCISNQIQNRQQLQTVLLNRESRSQQYLRNKEHLKLTEQESLEKAELNRMKQEEEKMMKFIINDIKREIAKENAERIKKQEHEAKLQIKQQREQIEKKMELRLKVAQDTEEQKAKIREKMQNHQYQDVLVYLDHHKSEVSHRKSNPSSQPALISPHIQQKESQSVDFCLNPNIGQLTQFQCNELVNLMDGKELQEFEVAHLIEKQYGQFKKQMEQQQWAGMYC